MQLELGALASSFEDRDFPSGECRTIVRDRGTEAGWHRGTPGFSCWFSPAASPAPRRNCAPGELTRTIVRLPDRTRARPGGSHPVIFLIKKFILGVDTLYYMGYYGITNEWIATFADEETYAACLPALKKYAEKNRGEIVESVNADKE